MTYLTQHLPFTPSSPSSSSSSSSTSTSSALPPPGTQLIISDTLQSPAHFALYHLVSSALGRERGGGGGGEKRKVIWVDFRGEARASWESVLKKLGTPLPPASSPSFIHLSPSSLPSSASASASASASSIPIPLFTDTPDLSPTYQAILPHLSPSSSAGSLVILDGLAELIWLGFAPVEVGRFVRAVLGKVIETNSILVSTIHADSLPLSSSASSTGSGASPVPETDLLLRLLRIGKGCWWRISHLPSGRSGDVMGEISSHPLSNPPGSLPLSNGAPSFPSVRRCKPLQYRLEQSTVRVFPKGTGRGFL